jgi:hydroxypyruvate isomerase
MNRRNFLSMSPALLVDINLSIKDMKNIKQSVMGWCYEGIPTLELAKHCKKIGINAIEGIDRSFYKNILELGMNISLVDSHNLSKGPCNPAFVEEVIIKLNDAIEVASSIGCKKVITFTGVCFDNMDINASKNLCIDTWKKVLSFAEKKGVTLVLEHLNSRVSNHPMKGHPGYFGDDVDMCIELVKTIGSPNFKLLFDVYHVQIMNGDIVNRIKDNKDIIAHIHTAGNPGRCEIDENQEINYKKIFNTLNEINYEGYVAHEFIPTRSDKLSSLTHASKICNG